MIKKNKYLLFPLLMVFYEISTYLSNDMYLPALPQMMNDLGLSSQQAQLTLTAWFTGSASLPLFMGMISDRFGRRSVVLGGGLLYIIATAMCALTSNLTLLLWARFLEGAAIPSLLVAGYACIHELYDTKEAIKILALMGSISVLAPAFGPLFGSIVLLFTSWRGIFILILVWAIIALIALAKYMPETLPKEKRMPLHFKSLAQQYFNILTNKYFILLLSVFGLIFAGFIIWITAAPLLIIQHFHYSPLVFGLVQAGIFVVYIIANRSVKYLLETLGINKLIQFGLIITLTGGLLGAVFAYFNPNSLWWFLPTMTLYSFGGGLCFSPLNRMVIETSDEPMGVRVAMFTFLWTAFVVLGSVVPSIVLAQSVRGIAYPIAIAITISCLLKLYYHRLKSKELTCANPS